MLHDVSPGVRRSMWMAAALLAVVVALFGFSASAYAADLVVNDDGLGTSCSFPGTAGYATIGAAVSASGTGDTIKICNGEYLEAIDLSGRDLTIQGESMAGVLIATTPGSVHGLTGSGNLTLSDFTIVGPHGYYGIKLSGLPSTVSLTNITVLNSRRTNIDLNGLASATLKNVTAKDAVGGVGIAFTDVGNIVAENITTSGNSWGGMAVYTSRKSYNVPVLSVELKGTLSLNEVLPFWVGMDPASVLLPNNYYGIDSIKLNGLLPYMVTGFEPAETVFAFLPTPAAADTLRTQMLARYQNVSTPTQVTFTASDFVHIVGSTGNLGVMMASMAQPGDTIAVGAGTFQVNLAVDKHIRLVGIGADSDATKNTVLKNPGISVVDVTAGGPSTANPSLLKNFRVEPVNQTGIHFLDGATVNYVHVDGVKVVGSGVATGEVEFCFYVKPSAAVTNLVVENSSFDSCELGFAVSRAPGGVSGCASGSQTFDNVVVKNSTFRDNGNKGLYIEKVNNGTFENLIIANNGQRIAGSNSNYNAGFDVNVKCNTYSTLALNNLIVTRNGLGFKEGMGLGLKARGSGTDTGGGGYSSTPASLTNVTITGGAYIGNERGIRIGEPGQLLAQPAVTISSAAIYRNVHTYAGVDGSSYGDLINLSTAAVAATGNYWGTGGLASAVITTGPSATAPTTGGELASAVPVISVSIPSFTSYQPAAPGTLVVPVKVTPFATHVASLNFAVDFPACLTYTGISGPAGFTTSGVELPAKTLNVSLVSSAAAPAVTVMQGGDVINMVFNASTCPDGSLAFNFNNATNPASYGDPAGQDALVTTANGTVTFDVNVIPTSILVAGLTTVPFAENQHPLATVGTITRTDPDGFDAIYSLEANGACAGPLNHDLFTVSDDMLQAVKTFNYEATPGPFLVCVKANDSRGGIAYQQITINLQDVLESPATLAVADDTVHHNVVREGSATPLSMPLNFTLGAYTPSSMSFKLTYNASCLSFDPSNSPAGYVSESPAGTINFYFNAPGAGTLSTLLFKGISCAGLSTPVALNLGSIVAVDGPLAVPVTATSNTVTVIENSLRGDCNFSGVVNAGDFVATVLETFDADSSGSNWLAAPESTFVGSPYGCDSTQNGNVSVSDIPCTVNISFGNTAACTSAGVINPASIAAAELAIAADPVADAGASFDVPVVFDAKGAQVAALMFTLKLDPAKVAFDATDANGDGTPDAVTLNLAAGQAGVAVYDEAGGKLNIALFGVILPMPTVDGPVATVTLKSVSGGAASLAFDGASASTMDSVPVVVLSRVGDQNSMNKFNYLPLLQK